MPKFTRIENRYYSQEEIEKISAEYDPTLGLDQDTRDDLNNLNRVILLREANSNNGKICSVLDRYLNLEVKQLNCEIGESERKEKRDLYLRIREFESIVRHTSQDIGSKIVQVIEE